MPAPMDDDDDLFTDMAALGAAATEAHDAQEHPAIREDAADVGNQIVDKYRQ